MLVAKVAITFLFVLWSVRSVSLDVVIERLGDIHYVWILLVLVSLIIHSVLQSLRWLFIVRACGQLLSTAVALKVSFIALFFSQTLPSMIGGDAVRIWMLARGQQTGWRVAGYSVLIDRVVGLFALAVLVAVCLPWTFVLVPAPTARIAVSTLAVAGVGGGIAFAGLWRLKATLLDRIWGMRHFVLASEIMRRLYNNAGLAAFVVISSIGSHLMTVIAAWAAAQSIDATVSLFQLTCLVPPVILVSVAPVTIAGWGLREGLMVLAFTLAGLNSGDALVISLLLGTASFGVGLIGGALWLVGSGNTKRAQLHRVL